MLVCTRETHPLSEEQGSSSCIRAGQQYRGENNVSQEGH